MRADRGERGRLGRVDEVLRRQPEVAPDAKGADRRRAEHGAEEAEEPDHAQRGLNCRVWLGSAAAGLQLNLQGTEQVMTLLACDHPWPRVT